MVIKKLKNGTTSITGLTDKEMSMLKYGCECAVMGYNGAATPRRKGKVDADMVERIKELEDDYRKLEKELRGA